MVQTQPQQLSKLEVSEYNRKLDRVFKNLTLPDIDRILKSYSKIHKQRLNVAFKVLKDQARADLLENIKKEVPKEFFENFSKLQTFFSLEGFDNETNAKEFFNFVNKINEAYPKAKA